MSTEQYNLLDLTADIVSAFVSNNAARATDLPDIIATVHASLEKIGEPKHDAVPEPAPTPAVPIKRSITPDYLICLEDGKKFKSLRRHLATGFGMTPEDYRAKWGLPRDYPMVAPGYAAKRSQLAKESGLGIGRRRPEAASAQTAPVAKVPANDSAMAQPAAKKTAAKRGKVAKDIVSEPAKRRGRPKKAA